VLRAVLKLLPRFLLLVSVPAGPPTTVKKPRS
jgi:hypothetical protein